MADLLNHVNPKNYIQRPQLKGCMFSYNIFQGYATCNLKSTYLISNCTHNKISSVLPDLISFVIRIWVFDISSYVPPIQTFLKDFPSALQIQAVRRNGSTKLFLEGLGQNLYVSVCLMSWFGCPLKCSFQSGYFGPQLDSLAVCLHTVVYHPLQQLLLFVAVCIHLCV